ncbi:PASTA domain-containing protein [candidate division KSB1 bacterium]|nr:PASTA domain-containing protein [candidate division KSB1 bacterium]
MNTNEKIHSVITWLQRLNLKKPLIILAGLLVFILIMDNIVMPIYVRLGQEYEIPKITELTYSDAELILQDQGFKIVLESQRYDSRFPPNYVISQNPPAFTRVKKGRRVYVVTSMGERYFKVPVLVGKGERDAKLTIQAAGLILDHVSPEHSSYYPEGVISEQSIQPGREVKAGTKISIVVSIGPFPDRFLVPFVIGADLDAAERLLKKAGLQVGSISYQVTDKLLPNTVLKQSIEADTEVFSGERIDLVVSVLPDENAEAAYDSGR